MQLKTVLGWCILLLICFIPFGLWQIFGPGISEMVNYASITHSLGEVFGLIGMTMFAMTFVLSTRIPFIEDVFGGLDKVYIVHGILGGTALILILFHPILLVLKFFPAQTALAAKYLLPSSYWSVNLGIIALFGIIILIFITLFSKIKYNRWKFTHEFLGLMFVFAVLHIFLVRNTISQDNIFNGYYIYAAIVSGIGLGSFAYSLFIKGRLFKNAIYTVKEIKKKGSFFEVEMRPEHKPISYKAGQFVFLRFYNKHLSKESHPFSIASQSNNPNLKVVIKKLGDFTQNMETLKKGDKIGVEGPYGRFSMLSKSKNDHVWIAGGIGVTPFLGMVQDLETTDTPEKVWLFYSVNDDADFIGYDVFQHVSQQTKKFKFVPWNSKKQGHLTAKSIHAESGKFREKEFYLCGPERFKQGIIESLLRAGVSKIHIHEEAFDFR
jgi:predicted ferric reductase